MRVRACAAALGLVVGSVLAGAPVLTTPAVAAPQPINPDDCKRKQGTTVGSTWAIKRLDLARTAGVTQGRSVSTGQPIRVAVIDSGLDQTHHPQLRGIDAAKLMDAIPNDPGRRYPDCYSHGTWVTAIIAAQRSATERRFFGVAPQVRILPIKVTNGQQVQSADVARAIDMAVNAKAQIVNLSLGVGNDPLVRAAVARAQQAGVLLVAAAGNDNEQANRLPQYPAAYSTQYDNVIAVGAIQPSGDQIANFSGTGSYLDIAAPGQAIQTVGVDGGYLVQSGTSFATPYVTGTAALVLAANPGMSAAQLRTRIETTADTPPATVPDSQYGYGVLNPYLAVTAVRTDSHVAPAPAARQTVPQLGIPPTPPDRTTAHVALGVGFGLLGLAALVVVGAAVLRGRRAAPAGPAPG